MKTRFRLFITLLTVLTLALTLSACGKEEPTATPVPPTSTPVPPTATPVPPTDTPVPPTATPVPPTDTPVPPTDTPVPPTPTPEPPSALDLTAEYADEESGLNLQLPEEWTAMSFFGITFIAESQDAINGIMAEEMPEAVAIVAVGSSEEMDIDLTEVQNPADLFEKTDEMPLSDDSEIGEIEELEIDGYPAAAAVITNIDLDSKDPMNGYFVTVILADQDRVAMFIGAATPERWEEVLPAFKAMAQSMTFSEPQAAELPTAEPTPAAGLPTAYTDDEAGINIQLPEGWVATPFWGMTLIVESQEALAAMSDEMPEVAVYLFSRPFDDMSIDPAALENPADLFDTKGVGPLDDDKALSANWDIIETVELEIDGYPAAAVEFVSDADTDDEMSGYAVVVVEKDLERISLFVGGTVSDRWEEMAPLIKAAAQSMTFFKPQTAAGPTVEPPVAGEEMGQTRANPVPLGQVTSAAQWDIQVLEVLRGDEAWDALLAASEWNDPPTAGFEYVLVKIAAERTGDNEAKEIGSADFDITGDKAVLYIAPWLPNLDPELDAELLPGGTTEGWLSFTVQEGEENLILVYDEVWEWDDKPIYLALEKDAAIAIPADLSSDGDAKSGVSRAEPADLGVKIFQDPWEVEVLQVIRGDEAYEAIMEANEWNDPPRDGLEYMLLYIHVRNLNAQEEAQDIDSSMFQVTADNNILYSYPYVTEPEPELIARLYPGGEWTGWLAYEIGIGEENPLLVFGDVWSIGEKGRFIALEEGAAVTFPADIEVTGDQVSGTALDDPAPAGTVIATEQWEFTVLEVLRGDEAWDALYEASEYNDEPDKGMEYVLVRVNVRNIAGDDVPVLANNNLFDIVGDDKDIYDKPFVTVPEPKLDAWLYPNGEAEGWVALQAAKDESGLTLILTDSYFVTEKRYLSLEE